MCPSVLLRGSNMPTSEIRAAGIDDLALLHSNIYRLLDLIPGRAAVHVVELVEIDVIRLQALQARV